MFLKIFIQKYGWTLTAIEADCGRATEVTGMLLENTGFIVSKFRRFCMCAVQFLAFGTRGVGKNRSSIKHARRDGSKMVGETRSRFI